MSKTLKVNFKRQVAMLDRDVTDIGFEIPGHKLKWISSTKQESGITRIWEILRRDDLDPEAVKQMERRNPTIFSNGNTIRLGDLVLGYAPIDRVKEQRELMDMTARQRVQQVQRAPHASRNVQVMKNETEVR